MSRFNFRIPSKGQTNSWNQASSDEDYFVYRNQETIEGQIAKDNDLDVRSQPLSGSTNREVDSIYI
jgi:hypothetical protein